MRIVVLPIMVLSGMGFTLSLIAHGLAVAGVQLPGGAAVFALHVGVLLVWFPTVLVLTRVTRGGARSDLWKVVLSGCPPWMNWAVRILFGYALLNFVLFAADTGGSRGATAGDPTVVRGFSGHWLLFYGVAFALCQGELSPKSGARWLDNFINLRVA